MARFWESSCGATRRKSAYSKRSLRKLLLWGEKASTPAVQRCPRAVLVSTPHMAANNKAGEANIEGYIALPDPEQMQDGR